MQSMTLEQLCAASDARGVAGVTLKGQGGFFIQITPRSGTDAVLAKARSSEPPGFGNPAAALNVSRDVGITIGQFDASEWKQGLAACTASGAWPHRATRPSELCT